MKMKQEKRKLKCTWRHLSGFVILVISLITTVNLLEFVEWELERERNIVKKAFENGEVALGDDVPTVLYKYKYLGMIRWSA
jgi:hypothetical protein